MADTSSFYLVQADAARKSGEAAQLANVRESFERAEKVWRNLAEKAQRVSDARQQREADTAISRANAEADASPETEYLPPLEDLD